MLHRPQDHADTPDHAATAAVVAERLAVDPARGLSAGRDRAAASCPRREPHCRGGYTPTRDHVAASIHQRAHLGARRSSGDRRLDRGGDRRRRHPDHRPAQCGDRLCAGVPRRARPPGAPIVEHTQGAGGSRWRSAGRVPDTALVPGDVVLLEAGNVVAADLRILEGRRSDHRRGCADR